MSGFLNSLQAETRSTLANPAKWLTAWFRGGGKDTFTGSTVNETTALNYTAVYGCVLILSNTIGSLPHEIRRQTGDGFSDQARSHPLWDLLHNAPNEDMDAMQFRETLQGHVSTWGNAYAQQVRDSAGVLKELWPLRPDLMTVERDLSRRLIYRYRLETGRERIFNRNEIFHLAGFGFDGVQGYSPISLARQPIALGLGTEEFGGRFFGNGANHSGVLQHPAKLSDEVFDRLRKSHREKNQGLENAWNPLILEEDMKWQSIGIPARDAQFLETRKFQLEEIARIYRVPLHLLQNLDRATFNNIQELGISFLIYTLLPWQVRWEKAVDTQLLTPFDRRNGFFSKLRTKALLRGNVEQQSKFYVDGRQWGWFTANDIMRFEDMPRIPAELGGDDYLQAGNMIPSGQDGQARLLRSLLMGSEFAGKSNGHAGGHDGTTSV